MTRSREQNRIYNIAYRNRHRDGRFAGKPAGRVGGKGYREIAISGRRFQAHRLAWFLATGTWPSEEIDHINGDKADNRLANLREVSHAENGRNQPRPSNNRSGVIGVGWNATAGKWAARIKVDGWSRFLGYFDDVSGAAKARKAAELEHGFHQNHGR